MKKNMKKTMDRLEIDEGIRDTVKSLWKHCYKTKNSCQGHLPSREDPEGTVKYVEIYNNTGDGWWDKENILKHGFVAYSSHLTTDPNTTNWYGKDIRGSCGEEYVSFI